MIINGVYDKTLFRNEQNGYTIFTFATKDADEYKSDNGNLVCCGRILRYTKGIPLIITGEPEFKNQKWSFIVNDIKEYSNEEKTTIAYLSSGIIKRIGEKTAKKIVEITGANIFDFVNGENAELILSENIPELKNGKASVFIDVIKNTINQRKVFEYVQKFGGTLTHAVELDKKHGLNAIKQLKLKAYTTGHSVGMPFAVCDAIAKSEGYHMYDTRRVRALILEAMIYASNSGNSYIKIDDLYYIVRGVCKNSAYDDDIPAVILMSVALNMKSIKIIEKENSSRFYLNTVWMSEEKAVSEIARIKNNITSLRFEDEALAAIEKKYDIKYSASQRASFNFLKTTGIKILTGGPGTGKTTVIKGLIDAYKTFNPDKVITLCAPTGRAAQRIYESTGIEASTIHRLIEYKPYGNDEYTCCDQSNPLAADLLIVDEMSMVDIELFALLLGAIKNNALVILCGDVDQLPSVGPGNVLKDLITSNQFEVNVLDTVYRQSVDSPIIYNANNIKNKNTNLKLCKDFKVITVKCESDIPKAICDIVKSVKDNGVEYFQVLSPSKKGDGGVNNLNKLIQPIYNKNTASYSYGHNKYKCGDKVMTIRNNYDLDYYNGDVGIVTYVDESKIKIEINGHDIEIKDNLFEDVTLAYASTIHKSQGSEYPMVIISLPRSPRMMLKRDLVYTAITRAKSNVIIVSEQDALQTAIHSVNTIIRKTSLKEKLIFSAKC